MSLIPRSSVFAPRFEFVRAIGAAALLLSALTAAHATEKAVVLPPPTIDVAAAPESEQTAVIAGGCFWGIQAVYQHTVGVIQAVSGYSGGTKQTAIYEVVSSGRTGHAESVQRMPSTSDLLGCLQRTLCERTTTTFRGDSGRL
jgi:hypothetical protein